MPILPLLITASVCALVPTLKTNAFEWTQLLPKEEKAHICKLANGVTTLIQENSFPMHGASLRVVVRSESNEVAVYSIDTSAYNREEIDQFLRVCRDRCSGFLNPEVAEEQKGVQQDLLHFTQDELTPRCSGKNLAIIAVGDFCPSPMQNLIESYFGEEHFHQEESLFQTPIQIGLSSLPSGVALHVDYPISRKELLTYADLKERWLQSFFQELLQQRLERLTRACKENWVHPRPRGIFPVSGFALVDGSMSSNMLSLLLWEIEQIKSEGFNEDEFFAVQNRVTYQLRQLVCNFSRADSAQIASFCADGFLAGRDDLCYGPFIQASEEIVPQITFSDVEPHVKFLLSDANRFIRVRYPRNHQEQVLTRANVEEIIESVSGLADFDRDSYCGEDDIMLLDFHPSRVTKPCPSVAVAQGAALLQVSHQSQNEVDLFQSLPLTHSEKETISYIVKNLAEKNVFELLFDKKKMEKKGESIEHVHPLRFIGYIFGNNDLKRSIRKVRKSSYKWDGFMKGFTRRMKQEGSQDNLFQYVPGFAKQVNANPDRVTHYIQKKDWDGLVRYLM